MRILPVIDIKNGVVVRGVAGLRDSYRPVQSELTSSAAVIDVAEALRDRFAIDELYIADLDAILEDCPNWRCVEALADRGFRLAIDAGLRDVSRASRLMGCGAAAVIAGLETAPSPDFLASVCDAIGSSNLIFSLDLQDGVPITSFDTWAETPLEIVSQADCAGVRRLIVLDLAAVGVGSGAATVELCRKIRLQLPQSELITGGGIRDVGDLRMLDATGVDAVLVASALHNGAITSADVSQFG